MPVNLQLFPGEVSEPKPFIAVTQQTELDHEAIQQAAKKLYAADKPGLFVGWGAVDASDEIVKIAEFLNAPVSTTLQGLSAFPANHPLHTGMSFGKASVPASENAFKHCDCMLAVATRFAEIATGSYGVTPPENLIHIDINPKVFNANYSAAITIEGDSRAVLKELYRSLQALGEPKLITVL